MSYASRLRSEKITVPFPFRKDHLDKWSEEFRTFGNMGGPPPSGRKQPWQRPSSSPSVSTLYLGSGRQYDRAEAARVAAAERANDFAHTSAYPSAGLCARSPPRTACVKLTPGGL